MWLEMSVTTEREVTKILDGKRGDQYLSHDNVHMESVTYDGERGDRHVSNKTSTWNQ